MIPAEEQPTDNSEFWSLAEAVCNGTIGAEQYARLNALLLADEDAARRYATYVRMHGLLLWRWQDADAPPPPVPEVQGGDAVLNCCARIGHAGNPAVSAPNRLRATSLRRW